MDAGHVDDRAAPVHSALARHACAATVAQAGDEITAQLTEGMCIDSRVDAFVRDMHARIFRPGTRLDRFSACAGRLA
jgi:hypothetical protein